MVFSKAPSSASDDYDPIQSIQELSANLTQPDRFAEIFCAAAKSQKKIDETLKEVIIGLLKKDMDTQEAIKVQVREVNKTDWKNFGGKAGFAIWSIFLIVVTVVVERLIGK